MLQQHDAYANRGMNVTALWSARTCSLPSFDILCHTAKRDLKSLTCQVACKDVERTHYRQTLSRQRLTLYRRRKLRYFRPVPGTWRSRRFRGHWRCCVDPKSQRRSHRFFPWPELDRSCCARFRRSFRWRRCVRFVIASRLRCRRGS